MWAVTVETLERYRRGDKDEPGMGLARKLLEEHDPDLVEGMPEADWRELARQPAPEARAMNIEPSLEFMEALIRETNELHADSALLQYRALLGMAHRFEDRDRRFFFSGLLIGGMHRLNLAGEQAARRQEIGEWSLEQIGYPVRE